MIRSLAILALAFLIGATPAYAAVGVTVDGTNEMMYVSDGATYVGLFGIFIKNNGASTYDYTQISWASSDYGPVYADNIYYSGYPSEEITLVQYESGTDACIGVHTTYASCIAQPGVIGHGGTGYALSGASFAAVGPAPVLGCMDEEASNYDPDATEDDGSCEYDEPGDPEGGIFGVIAGADEGFEDATGFSVNAIIEWMGDMILTFIGSGIALIDAIKWWIAALASLSVIVFFVFKGLRFFKASK